METKESLILERQDVIDDIKNLQGIAIKFGITGNRKYFQRGTIDKAVWFGYKENSSRILQNEKKLIAINKKLRGFEDIEKNDKENLLQIIKEILPKQDYENIKKEMERRTNRETAFFVTLSDKSNNSNSDVIKSFKKIAQSLCQTLREARTGINKYISENEPNVNKAAYLQQVSILNKCCPPIQEIDTIIRKIEKS